MKQSVNDQNKAMEIRLRHERALGKLLFEGNFSTEDQEWRHILENSGLSMPDAIILARLAKLPDHLFDKYMADKQASNEDLTVRDAWEYALK